MKKLPEQIFEQVEQEIVIACLDVIVVNDKNEVLLGKRKNYPLKDWWIFGGRMSVGEDYKSATKRVLKEEYGNRKAIF